MFANHESYYPLHLHLQHLKEVPRHIEEMAYITSDTAGRAASGRAASSGPAGRAP